MDVVYILGNGSRWKDNEIRYSLRSIEKHLTGFDKVFIVGSKPDFLQGVIHLPAEDCYPQDELRRNYNIQAKVCMACNCELVSKDFVFFNDDHFMLEDMHVNEIKYWNDGGWDAPILRANVAYKRTLHNTKPFSNLHYDIHTPIVYNKERFLDRMAKVNWSKEYAIKSLYCGFDTEGEFMDDLKVNARLTVAQWEKLVVGRAFFSIGDGALCPEFYEFMQKTFPDKSKYES